MDCIAISRPDVVGTDIHVPRALRNDLREAHLLPFSLTKG